MHAGLVAVIVIVLLMAGGPRAPLSWRRRVSGLMYGDRTRPGDNSVVPTMDFLGLGRHLVIGVHACTVYHNAILPQICSIPH